MIFRTFPYVCNAMISKFVLNLIYFLALSKYDPINIKHNTVRGFGDSGEPKKKVNC